VGDRVERENENGSLPTLEQMFIDLGTLIEKNVQYGWQMWLL